MICSHISFILSITLFITLPNGNSAQTAKSVSLPGTIFFNSETYLQFDDLLFINGSIAPTSRLNKYKSIKILYENMIRVISLTVIKYLRVDQYKIKISQMGNEVLRNAMIRIETKGRQTWDIRYFELEWILVRVKDEETGEPVERKIEFVVDGKLNIKKILLD